MRFSFLAAFFFLAPALFAEDSSLSAKIASLAGAYVGWGVSGSTPGAAVSFQQISRIGQKPAYHIVVSGLPLDGIYALVAWPITSARPAVLRSPVYLDKSGVLLCVRNGNVNSSDDTENLTIDNVRGEPARIGVISLQDKTVRALGKITPEPIESTDRKCRLNATYLTSRGEVVFVEASGLASGEAFTMTLHSGSKDVTQQAKASQTGAYQISFLPVDPKSASHKGIADLHLSAPSCSPDLKFAWGNLNEQ